MIPHDLANIYRIIFKEQNTIRITSIKRIGNSITFMLEAEVPSIYHGQHSVGTRRRSKYLLIPHYYEKSKEPHITAFEIFDWNKWRAWREED